jgi:2-polyprenyl-3-methyl-5-hydroxy-6-metoxy-1,4-benzoquinol methylase
MGMPALRRPRHGHNAHYHEYILGQLPSRFERALDVGCGSGVFARRLAARAEAVDAIDLSAEMVADAAASAPDLTKVAWIQGDLLSLDLPIAGYDVVTSIASLHQMPLDRALQRLAELVRPSGILAILGLYRPVTIGDYALNAIATIVNQFGWGRTTDPRMPVCKPATSLAEITQAAALHLPGAQIRRHLFYRYSLTWRRPR